MPIYIFHGKVIPERAAVTIRVSPFSIQAPDASIDLNMTVAIEVSQVSVMASSKTTQDLETIRNYVNSFVQALLDAYGYIEGRGYGCEIDSVTLDDGKMGVFGVEVSQLQKLRSERPVDFGQLFQIIIGSPNNQSAAHQLRRALGDLRMAIREPHDTGFACYRAVECLRQSFVEVKDGNNTKPSWKRLRKALRVDRSWFKKLEKYGNPQRHGATQYMSGQERISVMQHAWKVIDRFVVYVQRGSQPLPEKDFCLLLVK